MSGRGVQGQGAMGQRHGNLIRSRGRADAATSAKTTPPAKRFDCFRPLTILNVAPHVECSFVHSLDSLIS